MVSRYCNRHCVLTIGLLTILFVAPVYADIAQWEKGADITPTTSTDFGSTTFDQSLTALKATHANAVSFVVQLYQSDTHSSDVAPGSNTPTDTSLVHAIKKAHALDMAVTIKFHDDSRTGEWRALIDPSDRTEWFATYGAQVKHYAQVAQNNRVEEIVIGTEMIDLSSDAHNSTNTANWRALIASVRTLFTGKLTYAANWGTGWADEKNQIAFWDALDYAGIDAYYTLGSNYNENSVSSYLTYWDQWAMSDVSQFQQKVNKPIIFTEVGYKSTTGAHVVPGDYTIEHGYNDTEQAHAYEALFSYWATVGYIKGLYLWEWKSTPNAGGVGDTDYTPQNKTAQNVMTSWFGGSGIAISRPQPPIIRTTAKITHAIIPLGTSQTITATVENAGGTLSNSIVDIEIYNASGAKVYQHYEENQTMGASSSVAYSVSWLAPEPGIYTVSIGVFGQGWNPAYIWSGSIATFTVGDTVTLPPVFNTSTTVSTASVVVNNQEGIMVNVQNTGGAMSNGLIDIEIYNGANQQVFQKFYDAQSFNTNESKQFQINWGVQRIDTYRIAVGVFGTEWSKNYIWIDSTATFKGVGPSPITIVPTPTPTTTTIATTTPVIIPISTTTPVVIISTPTSTTPIIATTSPATTTLPVMIPVVSTSTVATTTAPTTIIVLPITTPVVPPSVPLNMQVWWPTTNSTIGGTLPFKAMLNTMPVDTYEMYWQVDGGSQNWMYNAPQEYPHKEAWVDVSGWNWKGSGPYTLTFIAKNSTGILITKDVLVNIAH